MVALAKVCGPAEALEALRPLDRDPELRRYHPLLAVRGQLLLDLGRSAEAARAFRSALACSCSNPERRFLLRKLEMCGSSAGRAC